MQLQIPPDALVFRIVIVTLTVSDDGISKMIEKKSSWHLFEKFIDNGFTRKSNPMQPAWWSSSTIRAYCGKRVDTRYLMKKEDVVGERIEFKTLKEIEKICPSCFPYHYEGK